jgi:hypothetical protein
MLEPWNKRNIILSSKKYLNRTANKETKLTPIKTFIVTPASADHLGTLAPRRCR